MIRFPVGLRTVGANGSHRSGWPYAVQALQPLVRTDGVLFDDFVERTFLYKSGRTLPWTEPWIGVFHYPPSKIDALWRRPAFVGSLPHLVGAIALSSHLGTWLTRHLPIGVPVRVVKHPTEIPALRFQLDRYLAAPTMVQVGWFLRNQDAITQVPVASGVRKVHLRARSSVAARARAQMQASNRFHRPRRGQTRVQEYVSAAEYDELLSRSVVFGEYVDASASNTIVESMARATPVIVNRLPAHEEYLGASYPLFYQRFEEVPALLAKDRVTEAHHYLRERPWPWLTAEAFRASVATFVTATTGATV